MKTLVLFSVLLTFAVVAGDDVQKAVEVRNLTVQKAKEVFDKAETAANVKLVADLKLLLNRPNIDKVAIATEILKVDGKDKDAIAIINKEGTLADLPLTDAEKGKAIYKVWSDKSKLDLESTGLMDSVTGGKYTKFPNMQDKIVQITTILVIPENGEYKASLSPNTRAKVTLAGKVVDWSKPTIIPLPKGKYPLVAEFESFPKSFSIQFGKKSDVAIEPLRAPYMETNENALKEIRKPAN